MARNRIWWLAPAVVLTAGCSSPEDVQQRYDEMARTYDADMARAQEWNVHVLGIPVAGWVAILVVASVLVFALLVLAGLWAREALARRAKHRVDLAVERERTEQARISRAPCRVCFADPQVDAPARGETK